MTIPLGQCEHFNQVGPSKKSCFLIMWVFLFGGNSHKNYLQFGFFLNTYGQLFLSVVWDFVNNDISKIWKRNMLLMF
jgi:hypothetical protein